MDAGPSLPPRFLSSTATSPPHGDDRAGEAAEGMYAAVGAAVNGLEAEAATKAAETETFLAANADKIVAMRKTLTLSAKVKENLKDEVTGRIKFVVKISCSGGMTRDWELDKYYTGMCEQSSRHPPSFFDLVYIRLALY
jgi:hypothetical protein